MKIFVTGGTGQVGFELQRSLALLGKVYAPSRAELDLQDLAAVEHYLELLNPDLIVNTAAWTAVDAAETQTDIAFKLNAELPAILAAYAERRNLWLIHYSSDYVYPGTGITPWSEADPTGSLSKYGESKLAGDLAIEHANARHLIFRTSWVYSARGNNFMKTMLRLGADRETLSVVEDQRGAPTPARLIAEVTLLAVHRLQLKQPLAEGVYNVAPTGETSWHGFATAIFNKAVSLGYSLKINAAHVQPILTAEYPTAAQRPLNSRMQLNKLQQALSITLPDWQSQLGLTLKDYIDINGLQ